MPLSESEQDVIRVLRESKGPLTPKEMAERTKWEYSTLRNLMPAMARQGLLEKVSTGRYRPGRQSATVGDSVEEDVELSDAAIVVMDLETNEVWFTIELLPRLVVHKSKRFGGRQVRRDTEAEAW